MCINRAKIIKSVYKNEGKWIKYWIKSHSFIRLLLGEFGVIQVSKVDNLSVHIVVVKDNDDDDDDDDDVVLNQGLIILLTPYFLLNFRKCIIMSSDRRIVVLFCPKSIDLEILVFVATCFPFLTTLTRCNFKSKKVVLCRILFFRYSEYWLFPDYRVYMFFEGSQ